MDFCPLAPRPAYLPRPEPMPCPMRRFFLTCPAGGFKLLRLAICLFLDERQKVWNLLYHSAKRRSVRLLNHAVELLESERAHDHLVLLGGADRTAHQLDFDSSRH